MKECTGEDIDVFETLRNVHSYHFSDAANEFDQKWPATSAHWQSGTCSIERSKATLQKEKTSACVPLNVGITKYKKWARYAWELGCVINLQRWEPHAESATLEIAKFQNC